MVTRVMTNYHGLANNLKIITIHNNNFRKYGFIKGKLCICVFEYQSTQLQVCDVVF